MVTAALKLKDACSFERKAMPNLDSIFKSREITLPTKVHLVKSIVFPIVLYGHENQTIKKVSVFELWYWRRILRVHWTARSNQSILQEISPEYSFSSVQFSRSVVSDSLPPHELQHARPPCLSPTSGVHSHSCP